MSSETAFCVVALSAGCRKIRGPQHSLLDADCERLLSGMPVLDYSFTVDAPLQAVRTFHSDTRALKRLTPPPTIVQLHDVEPLGEGSVSRFTLWVGPLPLRWKAVHRNVTDHGFTDVQEEGPARKWEHTHTFVTLSDRVTEIREHIEYEHKRGWWGVVTRVLFARPNLVMMFAFRKHATRWHLCSQPCGEE